MAIHAVNGVGASGAVQATVVLPAVAQGAVPARVATPGIGLRR